MYTIGPINLFSTASPVLGKTYLEFECIVPNTGLQF